MGKPKYCLSNVNTEDCPCKGCIPPTRHTGCHSTCDSYIKWNIDHQHKLEQVKASNDMSTYYEGARRRNKALEQKGVSFGRGKK